MKITIMILLLFFYSCCVGVIDENKASNAIKVLKEWDKPTTSDIALVEINNQRFYIFYYSGNSSTIIKADNNYRVEQSYISLLKTWDKPTGSAIALVELDGKEYYIFYYGSLQVIPKENINSKYNNINLDSLKIEIKNEIIKEMKKDENWTGY